MDLSFIDVCSGCGGLSYGLKSVGMVPKLAVDIDKDAVEIYKKNVDWNALVKDICRLRLVKNQADILVGGLPCQGFSTLGKRNVYDERNYLWVQFLRLIRESKPSALLVENVPEFLQTFHFKKFSQKVSKMGYKTVWGVLNAVNFNVPQNRRRAIFMGALNRVPELPATNEKILTVRNAIGDLPLIPDGKNDHTSRNPTKLSLKRYKCIPEGGNRFDLPKRLQSPCWRKLGKKGASNVFGRLWWNKPSATIRTTFVQPECGRYLHPKADRPITIREGARLQSFPDSFIFEGSIKAKTKMIGNAVPIKFAESLGESLISAV
jgi:DNA (cytosine-5)-methyltransferase 1